MPVKKKDDAPQDVVAIQPLETMTLRFRLLGTTGLIMNRQSEKARRQLLLPPRKANKAEREQTLKHNPFEEFRGSAYISSRPGDRTYLHMPSGSFKRAIAEAAVDLPGAAKAQIGRLVSLGMTTVDIWGMPLLRFDMVRQAGISKTPDTRFRACLPEWCCEITVNFISSVISPQSIANLINAAGLIRGVGDYRVEKGAGDFGQFRIVPDDDSEWHRIVKEQGREVQERRMAEPLYFDEEAESLCTWYLEEVERRRGAPKASKTVKARRGKTVEMVNDEDDEEALTNGEATL